MKIHKQEYQNIELETEDGLKNINEYIIYITQLVKYGAENEKYEVQDIYNINIVDFKEIVNRQYIPQYHKLIYSLNQDYNFQKDLCLMIQVEVIIIFII